MPRKLKATDGQAVVDLVKVCADNSRAIGTLAGEVLALKQTVKAQGEFIADQAARYEALRQRLISQGTILG